jgi:hypothetical protein
MDDDMRERADLRRKSAVARLVRMSDDDGSFDRAFWARYSPSERMAMAWQMVVERAAQQGIDADRLRLERSVTAVIRRRERDP